MRIKSRFFLVALLVASQAACLGFGVVWATGWLWTAFEVVVHQHVAAKGQALAHSLAVKTAELRLNTVEPGTADWQRLQRLVESAKIPHQGFACIMRADSGSMICHPKLADDPGLLRLFPGRCLLMSDTEAAPIIKMIADASFSDSRLISGKVDLDGELHVFTGFRLPSVNAVLAVYQSDYAIEQFIASTIRPVMQVGYALTAFIVGATGIITVFLINRYEAGLVEANLKLEQKVHERTRSLVRTRNAVIFGLAKLAESRDAGTGEHLERIRSYVTLLASELAKTNPEIDQKYVADLAVASSLHDIGKVGIPDGVLLKPGVLTPNERRAMELHTVLGSECLAAIQRQLEEDDFLELAQQIAAAHHEQWDGSGYPHGLQGKEIPLAARIVALADVYDALTTNRPYKEAASHAETREWIAARYGTHFDPVVVEAFVAREEDFIRVMSSYKESGGETREVVPEEVERLALVPR
ncbi:MAG: HD domain-containing phosphohydrolase [Planctomycetota bacterium]